MTDIDKYRSKAYVLQDLDFGAIFGLGRNPLSQREVFIFLYSLKIFSRFIC